MRVKVLKPIVGVDGKSFKEGEITCIMDEDLARHYVEIGYAEEAPEQPADIASLVVQGLVGTIKSLDERITEVVKTAVGHSTGPRIDPVTDPDDPDEPVTERDSPRVKQAKFGRFLQRIGIINGRDASHTAKQNAAEWLRNVYKAVPRDLDGVPNAAARTNMGQVQTGKMAIQKAASIEGSGPSLGYTVPPEFVTDIWKIAVEDSLLASKAKKRPMTSNELLYPKLDQTHTQSGSDTAYFGGVVARWSRETAPRSETEPKIRQGSLKAEELTGYSVFSNELLQDSGVALAAMIQELFGEAVGYYIDYAVLMGDGVGKPMGVRNAAATLIYTRKTANTVDYTDLTAMKRRILPRSRKNAFWAVSLGAEDTVWNMADTAGRPLFLPNFPGATGGPITADVGSGRQNILGLPYEVTEKLPALGTTGDLMLIAPDGYLIGERMGLEIAASPHVYFLNNETTYRFVARVAGQPLLDAPFTLRDGATQASHFVALGSNP